MIVVMTKTVQTISMRMTPTVMMMTTVMEIGQDCKNVPMKKVLMMTMNYRSYRVEHGRTATVTK